MRQLLFLLLTVCILPVYAQSSETFSGSFSNTPLTVALSEIEQSSAYVFYYEKSWIDSLYVSGSFTATEIPAVVSSLLSGTTLSFFEYKKAIILTNNVIINDKPAIAHSFFNQRRQATNEIEKGMVFQREYLSDGDETDENSVIEIGNRNLMKTGGSITIAGYIREKNNQEPVEGALIYIEEPFVSAISDASGFYSLTIPNGRKTVIVQFVGMKPVMRKIVGFSSGKLNIDMDVEIIALQEVTIQADKDINITNVQMGVTKLNVESIKNVPILLGERDILKIATTLAGVQTLGEGASGFNVRGGKSDQNLFLINNASIYNTSHFFGFFSVFNSDAIQNMEMYKSSIPASYGGRLSSVFDLQVKEASHQKFGGKGSVSPITTGLTLEIPIIREQTSLLVSGRTTYSNWVLKKVNNASFRENRVSFYDLLSQLNHKINDNNLLTFSAYHSNDAFRLNSDTLFSFSNFSYQNFNITSRWDHRFSDKFNGSISAVQTNYGYQIRYDESAPNAFSQNFDIAEKSAKVTFDYFFSDTHKLVFGSSLKTYLINPGEKLPLGEESLVPSLIIGKENGREAAIYLSDQYDISPRLSLSGGARFVFYQAVGERTSYRYLEGAPRNFYSRTDTLYYGKGEIIQTYSGLEPRFSARYTLDAVSSVKLSYNRNRQYIHTLTNSASLSPTDIWRLSSEYIRPQVADQVSLGLYRNFRGNSIETSLEGYYKNLQNLLDFKVGAEFLLNPAVETAVLQGRGKSYGVEFSVKKSGRLNGWFNYTYARTLIKLDGEFAEERINNGNFYPTSYDKPHTLNLVTNYKFTRRYSFSFNMNYYTGRPVTIPVSAYNVKGIPSIHYSDRNAFRIPDYFRVDVGLNIEGNHKIKKLAHSFWALSVYNLTGRDNPFSVFFDVKNGQIKGYQLIVFGNAIPTVSYNFKF
ncbi:MAG: TonB-dependent receptor [Cyclobacteriaceae bacterium]|nr:TonB-dependent receptor [Cyclobacteriaceae bacterium]